MGERNKQIENWLKKFIKMANNFYVEGNMPFCEYWRGQVIGICKVADLYRTGIDTDYYLKQLM